MIYFPYHTITFHFCIYSLLTINKVISVSIYIFLHYFPPICGNITTNRKGGLVMSWYALFVKTGYESNTKKWLDARYDRALLHCVIPRRKVPEKRGGKEYHVVKTLFPGYVFVQTKMNVHLYYQFKENPFIYRTLNYQNRRDKTFAYEEAWKLDSSAKLCDESELFKEIPVDEMTLVLKLIEQDDIIECSEISFQESGFTVQAGPLKGMESYIKKIDKHKKRAKVLMSLMGTAQLVDLGIEFSSVIPSGHQGEMR
ncbi:Transcription antitermination protein nusG [Paenibacillus mucilaginosus KNP414]|uniref:Transcription antitermination protein nusG n=2 Tax=Paenibacillus mucilaginosus TaxID=61624 RepID=F8FQZ2_PAEMK|nr:Transcription antitermination protein nusG [Paenibacillus mucilaginosus KNP414]